MIEQELPIPSDLGQAIMVIGILSRNVAQLTGAINDMHAEMATRPELEEVSRRLMGEIEALRAEVRKGSASSRLKMLADTAQQIGILFAITFATIGGIAAVVHFWDKLPK